MSGRPRRREKSSEKAWAASVDASGGINGHRVTVITEDDADNASTACQWSNNSSSRIMSWRSSGKRPVRRQPGLHTSNRALALRCRTQDQQPRESHLPTSVSGRRPFIYSCEPVGKDTHRHAGNRPPSSVMPTVTETLLPGDCLSNSTATARAPTSRDQPNPFFFTWSARWSTAACSAGARSSSRREAPGHERVSRTALRIRGSAAVNSSASAVDKISGGDNLITSG
jgi:hypothetical protein